MSEQKAGTKRKSEKGLVDLGGMDEHNKMTFEDKLKKFVNAGPPPKTLKGKKIDDVDLVTLSDEICSDLIKFVKKRGITRSRLRFHLVLTRHVLKKLTSRDEIKYFRTWESLLVAAISSFPAKENEEKTIISDEWKKKFLLAYNDFPQMEKFNESTANTMLDFERRHKIVADFVLNKIDSQPDKEHSDLNPLLIKIQIAVNEHAKLSERAIEKYGLVFVRYNKNSEKMMEHLPDGPFNAKLDKLLAEMAEQSKALCAEIKLLKPELALLLTKISEAEAEMKKNIN